MHCEAIEYRPYQSSKGFIVFMVVVIIFALVLLCVVTLADNYNVSIILIIAICILAISIKNIWFCVKTKIRLDTNGVHIYEKGNTSHIELSSISYSYLTKDYKGHEYLVLSNFPMSGEETKRAANKSAVKSRVFFGEWCAIYLDPFQLTVIDKIMQYVALICTRSN